MTTLSNYMVKAIMLVAEASDAEPEEVVNDVLIAANTIEHMYEEEEPAILLTSDEV